MGTRTRPSEKKDSDQVHKSSCRTCKPDKIKVVELVELVEYTGHKEHRKPKERRQYINLDAATDPNVPHPEYGRYIKLKARVEWDCVDDKAKPLIGRAVYWYSTSGSANLQGLDGDLMAGFVAPSTSGTDPAAKTKHIVSLTDDKGWTCVHFYLSIYGGDEFVVHATDNDKYEGGLKTETYKVWRRIWYQITHLNTHIVPEQDKAIAAYDQACCELVFSNDKTYNEAELRAITDDPDVSDRTLYPHWMVQKGGSSDTLESVVGDHNKQWFYEKKFDEEPTKAVKAHFIVCQNQWDPVKSIRKTVKMTYANQELEFEKLKRSEGFLKPALAGDLVVSGRWSCGKRHGTLTDVNVLVEKNSRTGKRDKLNVVKVALPSNAPVPTTRKPVKVKLELNYGKAYCGENNGYASLIVHDGNAKEFNETLAHELAHGLGQVAKVAQPPLEKHEYQYEYHGGQGSHCHFDATPSNEKDEHRDPVWTRGTCIMFHAGYSGCIEVFCPECIKYLKIRDISKPMFQKFDD